MYKFCSKCGGVTLGNKCLEEKCWVCGSILMPVPTKYIQENEILTNKELANKTVTLIEELVKTSPEFDQNLFDHRDEILTKKECCLRYGDGSWQSNIRRTVSSARMSYLP